MSKQMKNLTKKLDTEQKIHAELDKKVHSEEM